MKAIVQDQYGPAERVLQLREVDKPVVGEHEVLVRVVASCVHADVWHVVNGWPFVLRLMGAGLRKPKNPIPGTDVAGIVEAVGPGVTQFSPGDEVFGETHPYMQWVNGGAFAEYVAVPEDTLAKKPPNVSFEEAASVPTSGYIALHNLTQEGQLQEGQRVLVNGAGGGVGSLALQIAKAAGAEVTAVDCTDKLDLLRALGADRVIDYTQEDFTQGEGRYDLVLDVASTSSLSACRRVLTPGGKYVLIGHDHYGKGSSGKAFGQLPRFFGLMARTPFESHLPKQSFAIPKKKELIQRLAALLAAGKLTPIIDSTYALGDVHLAMQRLTDGKATGKIVLKP